MQKEALPEMRKFYDEKLKPMLSNLFTGMMDFIIYHLRQNSMIARLLFGETTKEREERSAVESSPEYSRILGQAEAEQAALPIEFRTGIMYEEVFRQAKEEMERRAKEEAARNRAPATPVDRPNRGGRPFGTLGVLGTTAEPQSGTVAIEQGERVLNPFETSTYNNLEQSLQRLNSLTAQMLGIMREQADYSRRNLDATKALSNNLFA
jgi:hypothetical protein